jgi:hypothetical protein
MHVNDRGKSRNALWHAAHYRVPLRRIGGWQHALEQPALTNWQLVCGETLQVHGLSIILSIVHSGSRERQRTVIDDILKVF